jgi:ATP-dependent Clp endopeptidase proteolytic subunit ClpP
MKPYEIELFSSIEEDALKTFSEQMKKVGARPIRLKINSPGGLVSEGLAMLALLQSHKPGVSVEILGICASMATVLACVGRPVRMAENGIYMIHNPWVETGGNAQKLRKTADQLDSFTKPMVDVYRARTGLPEAQIRSMMDCESWFSAAEAKQLNFIDEIGPPSAVAHASINAAARKWPKLAAALAKARNSNPQSLADQYAKMPPGPVRLAFFAANKWALFASRKTQHTK